VNAAQPPRVHAASIAALPDGRLFATWFGGEKEGGTEVSIYGAWRAADAHAWGPQHVIATPAQTSRDVGMLVRKMGNPVAFVTPRGELWLLYVSVTMGGWATSHLNLMRSPDLGQTWRPAQRLVLSPFFNLSTLAKGGPIFHADGSIGLPVYHELAGKFGEYLRLDSDGRLLGKTRMNHGHTSLQPVLMVQDARRAIALQRDATGTPPRAWRSLTDDAGAHWQAPTQTELANPNSALAALRLDDGRLIAVANDTEDERLRLSLLLSEDDGQHWRLLHRFEDRQAALGQLPDAAAMRSTLHGDIERLGPGPNAAEIATNVERNLCRHGATCQWQYDYPFLTQDGRGNFHLVYTWNRSLIRHIEFNRAWLEARQ
jgi:predicted neuraminidase